MRCLHGLLTWGFLGLVFWIYSAASAKEYPYDDDM
jgi:hypothetical protein